MREAATVGPEPRATVLSLDALLIAVAFVPPGRAGIVHRRWSGGTGPLGVTG
jgi:hypothetical protein